MIYAFIFNNIFPDALCFTNNNIRIQGYLGIPPFGFPEPLRSRVLKGRTIEGSGGLNCFDGRPGAQLPPYDFDINRKTLEEKWSADKISDYDVMSNAMYPAVSTQYSH